MGKGSTAVGVRGANCVVLGVEKKAVAKLQEDRTVRKICQLDEHVLMAFAGLTADARVLIKQARVECQSHKLTVEDPVTLEYITRHVASLKQRYTQSNGRNSKTVREFLEKSYAPDKVETEADTVKLAIKALLEVVQSGGKNLEICVMNQGQPMKMMSLPEIEAIVAVVEKEKEEEAAQKKKEKQSEKK